jgi:UBA/TS-N domain
MQLGVRVVTRFTAASFCHVHCSCSCTSALVLMLASFKRNSTRLLRRSHTHTSVCVPVMQPRLLCALSVTFTDKSVVYALALQLALCEGRASLAPALCGLVAGIAYRVNLLRLQRAYLPALVYRACALAHPVFRSSRRPDAAAAAAAARGGPSRRWARPQATPPRLRSGGPLLPTVANGGTARSRGQRAAGALSPRSALVPDAAEEAAAVRMLVSMGFRQADALAALRATGNIV